MKIVLDNKIICSLFPFLGKKGKGSEMEKIRVEVVGRVNNAYAWPVVLPWCGLGP